MAKPTASLPYRFAGPPRLITDPYLLDEIDGALPANFSGDPALLFWRPAHLDPAALKSRFTRRGERYQCKDREWWGPFDQDQIGRLVGLYLAGKVTEPVLLLDFGQAGVAIPDGAHRVAAALRAGMAEIAVLVCRLPGTSTG